MRVGVLIAMLVLTGCASASAAESDAVAYLAKYEVPLPTTSEVVVCHGFGCKFRTAVALNANDIRRLKEIMNRGERSARDEVNAIANAVSWFENRVGPVAGTSRRTPRAGPDQSGSSGEADCIDESVNTTALLILLSQLKLLRHHEIMGAASRGYLLDLKYPHATAVIADLRTGTRWAIDPWPKRNGERPDTLPLDRWMQGS